MQQNKTSLVQSPLMTRPGNEVGLFYNAPKPTGVGALVYISTHGEINKRNK